MKSKGLDGIFKCVFIFGYCEFIISLLTNNSKGLTVIFEQELK